MKIRLAFFALSMLAMLLPATRAAAEQTSSTTSRILVMVRHPVDHFRVGGAYGGSYGDDLSRSARERLARKIAQRNGLRLVEDWPMPMIGVDCFVMAVSDGRTPEMAIQQVSRDSAVAWAEPIALYSTRSAAAGHNDPLYAAQPAAQQWHLADLHRIASGRGSRVAVIDSGIDGAHPDLAGQLLLNRNFVSGQSLVAEEHGTAVAGIIAAKADNGLGIAGIAPGARLLGLRACWPQSPTLTSTECDTLSLAKALYFAVENRADVINLSLAGPSARLLRELIGIAYAHGAAVVGAFDPKLPGGGFPASVPGVIAVSDGAVAVPRGDVYIAPGRDVPTTQPGGRWFLVNGSSFAAAHVSGLIALARQRRPSGPLVLVAQRNTPGLVDACATLLRVAGQCDCACGSGNLVRSGGR
jgi:subtilisin family serine protease